jgi:Holliday junction resolvase RusA-like endonuclease
VIEFTVPGRAEPAGSKRAFPIKRANGTVGVSVTDANPRAKTWQAEVRSQAKDAIQDATLLEGPLELSLTFYLRHPKSHFGTGRNADQLRPSAPGYPTTKPDTTKLVRGVEDALTGVVWRDDAQIVHQVASKFYTRGPERCEVLIRQVIW